MAVSADPKVVVIIGCGIAGITAAHRLIKAGFHVRILEATTRSGGRLKTGMLGNTITEIGACYIHGASEENPVFCLARDYGLLNPEALTEENRAMDVGERPPWVPNWFSSSGQKLRAEQMNPAKEMFVELLKDISQVTNQEETQWASIGHFIRSEAPKQAAERWKDKNKTTRELLLCAISTMLKVECCDGATNSMGDVDLVGYAAFKNLIGLDCTLPCGFEGLIEKLMSELPSGSVSYNQPVRCVHWNDTGSGVNADTLRSTTRHCSVLLSRQTSCTQSRNWDSEHATKYLWSLNHLGGILTKDPSDQVSDISKLWIRKMASFTVLPPSERNSHVLCGWIAGHESEYMETLSGQEVRRSITELVRTFTGNPTITPRRISCSRWFHDPWTCGSYSHAAVGSSAQDLENMMEPLPLKGSQSQPLQVLFAGEATHPYHYSTVHGALLSGRREADRLIAHYSPTSSQVPASALAGGFMFFCLYVHFSVSCQVAFALDFDYERKMIEGIKTPYL
ncbi:peroxisomal N(1)-acetyl-spermine/spermidine oxidase-like isoform X2 [Scophthalmus maximus]|uniref:peroxisomal N(1)-acetyl-spermine/spermidine oxidase-like isoform X2 n=1 Tax=Scophthalmus maximus TaxID=52904 RepID=UPI001FA8C9E7|nr:peroxisomal N(1)-acetyl-spermine/spermidine oxidase-like isoform X2 [Scophthalmus maximus]